MSRQSQPSAIALALVRASLPTAPGVESTDPHAPAHRSKGEKHRNRKYRGRA